MPPFSVSAARNGPDSNPTFHQPTERIVMQTNIKIFGEITGTVWMPAVECSKEFHLELVRIPRTSRIRTYPGIMPRSMEITCLRDSLLHLTNDGDFQSCSIN